MGGTRHCPQCGEEYSDTYKRCPFCEEDEAIRTGKPLRRKGGKRLESRRRGGVGGVMLLVSAVIIMMVVGYVFFGDEAEDMLGIRADPEDGPDVSQVIQINDAPDSVPNAPVGSQKSVPEDGAEGEDAGAAPETGSMGADGEQDAGIDAQSDGQDAAGDDGSQEPQPLAISQESMTINAGETARLTTTGGTGAVVWATSNEHIATVDGGAVTGAAGGTVNITATAGEETVVCQVTINGEPWVSDAKLSLNKTDFTLPSGDPDVQMVVRGTDSPVTWSSNKTGVVTISESGVVKRVGKGTAEITASVDGQTLTCIVRCP